MAAHGRSATDGRFSKVKVPMLAVVGSLDEYLSDFNELKKMRPEVKLVVIDQARHGGSRGASLRPEFIIVVREFIASNTTAR